MPELEELSRSRPVAWPLQVLRSSQLDATRLDNEIHSMLQEQFMQVFSLFNPGQVASIEPELNALLSLLIFWLSVWQGRATPGSELMNLRYRNERALSWSPLAATVHAARGAGGDSAAAAGTAAGAAAAAPAAGGGAAVLADAERAASHEAASSSTPAVSWAGGGRTGVEGPGLTGGQRALFGFGHVLLPYLWHRAGRAAAAANAVAASGPDAWAGGGGGFGGDGGGGQASGGAWRLVRGVEAAYRVASLVNFWVFLWGGSYRSVLERLLGARLVYRQPSMSRLISFEYLNRQLVWQELSEFLLFVLPLVNVARLKRIVYGALPRPGAPGSGSWPVADDEGVAAAAAKPGDHAAASGGGDSGSDGNNGWGSVARPAAAAGAGAAPGSAGEPAHDSRVAGGPGLELQVGAGPGPPGPCPICGGAEILVPFVALPCRHVFCYYCLRSNCEADVGFVCPVDRQRVAAMRRYAARVPTHLQPPL